VENIKFKIVFISFMWNKSVCLGAHIVTLSVVASLFQLVELSKAQDIEAGDGTTSVVVVAGSLLEAAEKLLQRGIHPTIISDAFQRAAVKAVEILAGMSRPVELTDKESLIKSASTALNSKVQIIIHGHEDATTVWLPLSSI
jgi:hypothetical protein